MAWIKVGETILNTEQIAYVEPGTDFDSTVQADVPTLWVWFTGLPKAVFYEPEASALRRHLEGLSFVISPPSP